MNSNAINLTTKHKPNTGVFVDERRLLAPPIGEKMRDRSICKKIDLENASTTGQDKITGNYIQQCKKIGPNKC